MVASPFSLPLDDKSMFSQRKLVLSSRKIKRRRTRSASMPADTHTHDNNLRPVITTDEAAHENETKTRCA